MKICFCIDSLNSGGAERVMATLCNSLVNYGHDVLLVLTSSNSPIVFYELNYNVKVIKISEKLKNKRNIIKKIVSLRNLFKIELPDAVISFLPHVNIYVDLSLKKMNIPHIVSERNNPYTDPHNILIKKLKERVFRHADGCVFQTKDAYLYYANKIKGQYAIIKNPINLHTKRIRDNNNLENNIICVSRLEKQKNIKLLIDSFHLFHKENPDYKLYIIGDGTMRNSLQDYIKYLNLSEFVILTGRIKNWQDIFINSKLFVLPSNYEGMPNSLMEAMALNIPSIATNCPIGGPGELIKDHINGILVPVGDSISLFRAMEQIIDLKIEDNSYFSKVFSADAICSQWINFLKNIVN